MLANAITAARLVFLAPLWLLLARDDDRGRWFALGLYLLAGVSDILDGRIARARGEATPFGAMLDLIADRLLTLVVVTGLLAGGVLSGVAAIAAVVLIARDLLVASFGEALHGRLQIKVGALERAKIAFQFVGLALLIAPPILAFGALGQHPIGRAGVIAAAVLALLSLGDYSGRAGRAFRQQP